MGPGEEGYMLEQQWFNICQQSHDLWCLCGDYRQHFLPGCGVITEAGDPTGDEGDGIDEAMVNFDLGDVAAITEGGTDAETG